MSEKDIDFHLLIHSPNVCSSQEPRTPCKSLIGVAGTQVVGPLSAASQVHSREAGSEVELRLGPRRFRTGCVGCGYPRRWMNLWRHSICLLSCVHSHTCLSLGRALQMASPPRALEHCMHAWNIEVMGVVEPCFPFDHIQKWETRTEEASYLF